MLTSPEMSFAELISNFQTISCALFFKQVEVFINLGNYSILAVNFQFKRNIGYFVMQTYMPCMMIVVLSWVAFWINREAAPARISLGN